ncbi:hypothetical protein GCM10007278_09280 [Paenalcaligenes hominis]|nr:hypothetical protein GCM10007278_09280 [Paenalcaligenes hominis]
MARWLQLLRSLQALRKPSFEKPDGLPQPKLSELNVMPKVGHAVSRMKWYVVSIFKEQRLNTIEAALMRYLTDNNLT